MLTHTLESYIIIYAEKPQHILIQLLGTAGFDVLKEVKPITKRPVQTHQSRDAARYTAKFERQK